jgi:mRNA interferase MazF
MARSYIPERGDVVWLDFNPQAGREQAGRRPAVVLSPREYNKRSGLALLCPITSRVKNYPFEVRLPDAFDVRGVILCDQIKSLDWAARKLARQAQLDQSTMAHVLGKVHALLA